MQAYAESRLLRTQYQRHRRRVATNVLLLRMECWAPSAGIRTSSLFTFDHDVRGNEALVKFFSMTSAGQPTSVKWRTCGRSSPILLSYCEYCTVYTE
ncbi:hypothetical protein L227DRAFT_105415 [Lentinus tigrinus ALCF2SS1-6]|uniref:Uncharacterized protein n=1 Tax=Lentinus tigrinus ALCF2SS1-6 TaxID=1328759 RepID=A0A5C2S853_9APHY|nr:hypothetical protein L227DRAFT_105415 [Lentinus tigrinus ALCF2SS1-6]